MVSFEFLDHKSACVDTTVYARNPTPTVTTLLPDQKIALSVDRPAGVAHVLNAPWARGIGTLYYRGDASVELAPMFVDKCPILTELNVDLYDDRASLDFVSAILEHPENKIRKLAVFSLRTDGEQFLRFVAALAQSHVYSLGLHLRSPKYYLHVPAGLLHHENLVELKINMSSLPGLDALSACVHLTSLRLVCCVFSHVVRFPPTLTKLAVRFCKFNGVDWSFLERGVVQQLEIVTDRYDSAGCCTQIRRPLCARLRLGTLDSLTIGWTPDTAMSMVGSRLHRIKNLTFHWGNTSISRRSVAQIAYALHSSASAMRSLDFSVKNMNDFKALVLPAVEHPNCALVKLEHWGPHYREAIQRFHRRVAIFALLYGAQVRRRKHCALRRLPVEMFRLVSQMM